MKKIVVIGGGTMGLDIAQAFAKKGYDVVVRDINDAIIQASEARLNKGLDKLVSKGKLDEAGKKAITDKMTFTTDLNLAADADLVVEAAIENLDIKKSIFCGAGQDLQARDHSGFQHLLHLHYRHCRGHSAPRQVHRHALLQPRHRHEAGGGHPGRSHL